MDPVRLADLTRDQIGRAAPDSVALLPIGAIEQHGPHLPVGVDFEIVTEVATAAACRLQGQVGVLVAPTMPYGISGHHRPHPGVLTLDGPTLLAVLTQLMEGLFESGFRRMAIINGHNGNSEAVALVARDMNNRFPVTVAGASYWSMAAGHLTPEFWREGHAGESETALMMHLRPDTIVQPLPGQSPTPSSLRVGTARIFPAGSRQGLGSGYTDTPDTATPELGRQSFEACVAGVVDFLRQLHMSHPA